MRTKTLLERFEEKIEKTGSCWIWTASVNHHGYGQIRDGDKVLRAHRLAFELEYGRAPELLHHICLTRRCVNPAHLVEVNSHGDHSATHAGLRETCKRGHPWNEENTYVWNGHRFCRACKARWMRENYSPDGED